MSPYDNTPFFCPVYGLLWVPRPGHFPCDGAGNSADIRSTMCYCSIKDLIQEEQQELPTSASSGSDAVYYDARSTVDEHSAVDRPSPSGEGPSHSGPTSSGEEAGHSVATPSRDGASRGESVLPGDEARHNIYEGPVTPANLPLGYTYAADDYDSPPRAPERRRLYDVLAGRPPWDSSGESSDEHIGFASPQSSPSGPPRDRPGLLPYRRWNGAGASMAPWASQQHLSLPRFSPPPPRYSSSGEGRCGSGRRSNAAAGRPGEAAGGPEYPGHAPFIGRNGAQDNGRYPAPPPRPQQEPSLPSYPPRPSRFFRPRMTRWPTPQPLRRRRLDLETTYCPPHHAPGAVASSRTFFPEHEGPVTFNSGSSNSWGRRNGRSTSTMGINGGSNGAGANGHLNASSASPPPSPPREPTRRSPGPSPPRHVFQAELNFVQPDDAVFTMAAATRPRPQASSSERRQSFWQRVRNVVSAVVCVLDVLYHIVTKLTSRFTSGAGLVETEKIQGQRGERRGANRRRERQHRGVRASR